MRFVLCTVSLMALAGCNQSAAPTASGPKSPGRFAGIGVFAAGRLWGQMTGSAAAKDPAVAKLQDDEHIIVVMDSHTGDVRKCGRQRVLQLFGYARNTDRHSRACLV
jgi:hypothetical protein